MRRVPVINRGRTYGISGSGDSGIWEASSSRLRNEKRYGTIFVPCSENTEERYQMVVLEQ